jgi:hypothetical protein
MLAKVWRLSKVTFTGAAILLRSKAAYAGTSFVLSGDAPSTTKHGVEAFPALQPAAQRFA